MLLLVLIFLAKVFVFIRTFIPFVFQEFFLKIKIIMNYKIKIIMNKIVKTLFYLSLYPS